MAYNNGFPVNYPQYYPQYYQQPQQPQQQIQNLQQQQIQDGGFMVVPSEDIARSYPVAPGKCLTFKIEGKPIVIEKSMGFSQLEAPKIDRYRLTKEEAPAAIPKECHCSSDVEGLKSEINKLWDEVRRLEHESIKHVPADDAEPNADANTEV
jgi:hypothetical protein